MPHDIRIPRLGWSMEEGVFVGWLKQPGESVAVGEPLFELESDKALQQIEALDAGTLFVPPDAPAPGATVAVGALLGYLLAVGEPIPASATPRPTQRDPTNAPPAKAGPAVRRLARMLEVDLAQVVATGKRGRITCADVEASAAAIVSTSHTTPKPTASGPIASPRARRVAAALGVDWRSLRGSGRHGRIREADVLAAKDRAPNPLAGPRAGAIPLSPRRKSIIERLRQSRDRTIPVTLTTTADATALVALREQFRAAGEPIVPAYTDILAQIVAQVLASHPQMAVRWNDLGDALIPLELDDLHVAIAVDTPDGLLTPVVRDPAGKSLADLARDSQALIDRARRGRSTAADLDGAAITITNLGRYGIDAFTPIINYPQIAILGVGAIRLTPIVTRDGRIAPQHRLTLSLTFDHTAVDGAPAAAFVQHIAQAVAPEFVPPDIVAHDTTRR